MFSCPPTFEVYSLSLHDALPIFEAVLDVLSEGPPDGLTALGVGESLPDHAMRPRSEEHTSELQSRPHLVCRLLLEKKKTISGMTLRLMVLSLSCLGNTGQDCHAS